MDTSPKSEEAVLEINLKLKLNQYSFKIGTKRAWMVAIFILLTRIFGLLFHDGS